MKARVVQLLTRAFLQNPRMQSFVRGGKPTFRKVRPIMEYAYGIAHRLGGVFWAKNEKTVVLYYQKSRFSQSWSDMLNYLKIVLHCVGLRRVPSLYQRERLIKQMRASDSDYLYVWFLAQDRNYHKIDGLIEVNKHLIQRAKELQLPILIETTDKRNLSIYKRVGFKIYNTWHDQKHKLTVWYMRRDADLGIA